MTFLLDIVAWIVHTTGYAIVTYIAFSHNDPVCAGYVLIIAGATLHSWKLFRTIRRTYRRLTLDKSHSGQM